MIALHLWLATGYPFAVALVVAWCNARSRKPEYVGRHREGAVVVVEKSFNWQADFEARIAAKLAERKALVAAVKEKTQEMVVPDFDSDEGAYAHRSGAGRYNHLSPDELDAKADWEQLLAAHGLVLRSPYTSLDADVWDQAVMLTEVGR